jgi:uncharacterized membrane protein YbhN (UPF0104 family)
MAKSNTLHRQGEEKEGNKFKQVAIGLVFSAIFLWFAFRQVDISEVGSILSKISYGWLAPFTFFVLLAHWLRAVRWGLLIRKENIKVSDFSLFAAVMNMYAMNYAFPRLGEISRAWYIGKRNNLQVSTLLGTVVLERVVDTFTLGLIVGVSFLTVLSEPSIVRGLLGESMAEQINRFSFTEQWPWVLIMIVGAVGALLVLVKLMHWIADRDIRNPWMRKGQGFLVNFWNGLFSIADLPNWGWFTTHTLGIWFCYLMMTYIPFYMLDLVDIFNLSLLDGLLILAISSLGVVVPSPGGLGSYNYMVMLGMSVLHGIPESTGLAYSIAVYAANFGIIIVFAGITYLADRLKD